MMFPFSPLPFLKAEVVGSSCTISRAERLLVCLHVGGISEPQLPHSCREECREGGRAGGTRLPPGACDPPRAGSAVRALQEESQARVCPPLDNDLDQPKKFVYADSSVRKVAGLWQKQFGKASRAVSPDQLNYG